jgi:hypothetical protein
MVKYYLFEQLFEPTKNSFKINGLRRCHKARKAPLK